MMLSTQVCPLGHRAGWRVHGCVCGGGCRTGNIWPVRDGQGGLPAPGQTEREAGRARARHVLVPADVLGLCSCKAVASLPTHRKVAVILLWSKLPAPAWTWRRRRAISLAAPSSAAIRHSASHVK